MKCQKCPGWTNCPWQSDGLCWYEPNDYEEGDIGSATVAEMRKQNERAFNK